MFGGALGAYVLTAIPAEIIKPLVTIYLLLMGTWIVWKATATTASTSEPPSWVVPLGFGGGFLDAVGGGGWGPVVTSTLLGQGTKPRYRFGQCG